MVIRKPYAFLIKHFRLVHGLLFALLIYLAINTFDIYSFFNQYAVSHTYLNKADLALSYVPFSLYVCAVLAALILGIIYFLLSMKHKSNKIYLFGVFYYVVLLVFYIFIYGVFKKLELSSLNLETIRVYRDISLIAVLPQLVFVVLTLGRTLGFNLKQFNFKKDLEELEIDVSDNEEVELTFGNDTYKIARGFRRILRLTKYFFIENKLFVIFFASVFVFGISVYTFVSLNKYQKSYEEAQDLDVSSLKFNVKSSYITNVDMSNNVISDNHQYILVDINVKNKYSSEYALTRETFRLVVNGEMILPLFSLQKQFMDIGTTFTPTNLMGNEEREYIVVFEINSSDIEKEYLFRIKNNSNNNNLVDDHYKEVIIKPTNINNNKDAGTYKLPTEISLKETILGNSTVSIESYEIADKFKEKYKYTIENQEKEGIYSIIPVSTNKEALSVLKLKTNINIDQSVYFSKYINKPSDFFEHYGIIRYRYMGEYKNKKMTKINVGFETDNYSYMEVPKEIKEATKIDLIILIRGIKYTINLK